MDRGKMAVAKKILDRWKIAILRIVVKLYTYGGIPTTFLEYRPPAGAKWGIKKIRV